MAGFVFDDGVRVDVETVSQFVKRLDGTNRSTIGVLAINA
jgi:hypothetical protein